MNQYLKAIQDILKENNRLTEQDKEALLKTIADANKQWDIIDFKLDRTEKVKRTTAILLEETIAELENKRKAIEAQNRELEIESSLEKVRTVAMGMRKRDDMLDICRIISEQLESLGIKEIRNVQTAIFYKHKGTYINYEYYRLHDKALVTEVDYTNDEISIEFAAQMIKGADEVFIRSLEGQQVKDWLNVQRTTNVFIDTNLENAGSLTYYWFSLGPVAIGTSTYNPLNEEGISLFKRFRNVFDLAYRRYLDIEKAEAQVREAKIEAALEKVRSSSLAMHNTSELQEVIHVVHKELLNLNIAINGGSFIAINSDIETTLRCWGSGGTANTSEEVHLPLYEKPFCTNLINGIKNGPAFFTEEYTQKEKKEFFTFLFKYEPWSKLDTKQKKETLSSPGGYTRSCCVSQHTSIFIINHFGDKFSATDNDILQRFGKVFEQTYTRFLDLQKAEAQAKESQIQLALERVRARTMAMQHSNELAEAARVLYEEFRTLDINTFLCGYCFYKEEQGKQTVWVTLPDGTIIPDFIDFPITGDHILNKRYEDWKQKKPLHVLEIKGEENKEHHRFLASKVSDHTANEIFAQIPDRIIVYGANFSTGYLFIIATELLTGEEEDVIIRFAKAFELTYTRFSDLKQAEAQARESQIQLALERVRARTMAMQHSDELKNAAALLFQQVKSLGVPAYSCGYNIWEKDEKEFTSWMSTQDGSIINGVPNIPLTVDANFIRYVESKQNGEQFFVLELRGARMQEHYEYLKTIPAFKGYFDYAVSVGFDLPQTQIHHVANFSQGNLLFITLESCPEFHDVFKRFAAVFEQTYTRFLDLQKAEEQARESQIQLALERVRARTMAMQKSDELMEASNLLLQQVQSLGIPVWACGYNIWEIGEKVCTAWMSVLGAIQPSFRLPLTEHRTFIHMDESRLKAEASYVEEVSGEELADHYRYMFSLPDFREIATKQLQGSSFPLPQSQAHHVFNFKQGNLIFLSAEAIPEALDIFKRFTAVFEQTYTRFLDLQKAETQAREAKIEAALENVRSRSLAMHHSNELKEVVKKVFEKMKELGFFQNNSVMIVLPKNGFKDVLHWTFNEHFETMEYNIPAFNHSVSTDTYKAWKRGEKTFEIKLNKEEKDDFLYQIFKYTDYSKVPDEFKKHLYSTEAYNSFIVFENHCGLLVDTFTSVNYSEDQKDVVKRFAKVFEQAYIRFLDLQKAEAQARQAQIEASLERVRASAMAMHRSDELSNVLAILFEQFDVLKIQPVDVHLDLFDLERNTFSYRATGKEGKRVIAEQIVDLDSRPEWQALLQKWKKGKPDTVDFSYYPKEVIRELMAFFPDIWAAMPEDAIMSPEDFPDGIFDALGFCKFGYIGFHHHRKATEEEQKILIRFANEFERLYQRFLDLQKAEAQAREAQIELGLERVRARAMAMQKSDELKELVGTVYNELTKLDLVFDRCLIWVMNSEDFSSRLWMANAESQPVNFYIPHHDNPPYLAFVKAWKDRNKRWQYDLHGQVKKEWDGYVFNQTEMKHLPGPVKKNMQAIDRVMFAASFHNFGCLQTAGPEPLKEEQFDILNRFAKVFDLTYTRFNDLKQAEAQAREAQIELGLERVRARAMAMQKSDELSELVDTVFKELTKLDFALTWCIINIIDEPSMSNMVWAANPDIDKAPDSYHMKFEDYPFHHAMMKGWKERKAKYVYVLEGAEKKIYDKYLFNETEFRKVPEAAQAASSAMEKYVVSFSFSNFGGLQTVGDVPLSDANLDILSRFGKVFDLTYTRFNDLKQAEEQSRESQIQLALERVRARTMAMQRSDELQDAASLMVQQIQTLGVPQFGSGFNIWDDDRTAATAWMCNVTTDNLPPPFKTSSSEDIFLLIHNAAQRGESLFVREQAGEELKAHYRYMNSIPIFKEYVESASPEGLVIPEFQIMHCAFFSQGYLMFITYEYVPEAHDIFMRFAKVFEQTYTRFLDLQKAEAQAREAQIEAALERVRSRSMGMQKSDELKEVIQIVYQQFVHLNMNVEHTGFVMDYKAREDYDIWIADQLGVPSHVIIPYFDCVYYNRFNEAKKKGEDFFATNLDFEEKNRFYKKIIEYVPGLPEETKEFLFSIPGLAGSTVLLDNVCLYIENFSGIPYSDEENNTVMRFGKVFQQTYTRFLDLQKAEAQAREAKIETALEKVRSRTMAMQHSDELANVATVLFQQVKALGVPQWTCGFSIFEIDDKEFTWYPGSVDGDILSPSKIPLTEHPVFIQFNESRKRGDELFVYEKKGEVQADHYRYMCSLPGTGEFLQKMLDAGLTFPDFQIDHLANFSHGNLIFITYEPFPEMHDVFKRFAKVFEQTYTRFLDLKKAEAQALEAIKRASVDRIRAEIASMRTTNDLERITPLIWNELTTLGVPFVRCGVFIMDEKKQLVETHLSTPDGKAIASFTSTFTGTQLLTEILPYWQRKEVYKAHWDEAMFLEQAKSLVEQGSITSGGKYLTENRPTDLYLHFLPFLQGMLYAGNTTPLNDDALQLMQNLADAFSTAYARYEDFNKLEVAKEQIEKTLVDLKQAQQQLVQSEKMASLGELTAGIAHEIQNPLNFVNNFSDVNKELLEELKEEADKGNIEEIKAIANDVINNEEKINHHGKRADAIVKNMLQHSRSSGAIKELTDINKLADEYLRLSYHGLRAKDKIFNADFKTELDNSVGKINVIPQDIGRVILNIITNAFYAVNEKKKSPHPLKGGMEYKPTVSIITKKIGDNVEIIVADNGNGISQKNLDKIFQPFFTTKPTGQGTGLGLSLSYDIIKAHGGEIKVESKEGEGSEFTIQIPIN